MPVSEENPLENCKHFIAACQLPESIAVAEDSIEAFYMQLGVGLMATVMDGDCGIDVACLMLGLPQTLENRRKIREDMMLIFLEGWVLVAPIFILSFFHGDHGCAV